MYSRPPTAPPESSMHASRASRTAWALAKRSIGTMDLRIASFEGPSSPFMTAKAMTSAANRPAVIARAPSSAVAARDRARPITPRPIIMRLRSWRSVRVPPIGIRTRPIADSMVTIRPATKAEPDSCSAISGMTNARRLTATTSLVSAANQRRYAALRHSDADGEDADGDGIRLGEVSEVSMMDSFRGTARSPCRSLPCRTYGSGC